METVLRRGKVAALGCMVVLGGCTTTLDAVRVEGRSTLPAAGTPYSLPFTQYEIKVTRRVETCTDQELSVAVSAEVTPRQVADPAREYVIDFNALQSAMKKTNLTVDYHPNGGIKSVNASAEDRSGAVVASVAKIAGTVITAGAGVGALGIKTNLRPPKCNVATQTLVATTIPTLEKEIKADTATLADQTAHLDRLTAMATAMGDAWGDADRKRMGKAIEAVATTRDRLARKNRELDANLKKVSQVVEFKWPANGSIRTSGPDDVPALTRKEIANWVDLPKAGALGVDPVDVEQLIEAASVHLAIVPTTKLGEIDCATTCPSDGVKGLKYRMPAPGTLVVSTGTARTELMTKEGLLPQLGPIFTVPLKSVPFSNRTITAKFDENGLPTSLGVQSDAAAEAVAASMEGLIAQAAAVRQTLQSSDLEKLKTETELLKAQKELADAKKALAPPETDAHAEALAAFQADTAIKQAELANLEATRALAEAKQVSTGS